VARPFLETPFHETNAQISPDGRAAAYCSDQSGQTEVYVRDFPGGTRTRQASAAGGCQPRWSRGGRELLYVEGETLMSVAVGPDLALGEPAALFSHPGLAAGAPFFYTYDVWPDGEKAALVETSPLDGRRQPR